jgi:predicted O-methyltransferase YrrM
MHQLISDSLAELRRRTGWGPLHILETGTIRNSDEEYRTGDGWSTLAFAEDIAVHGGTLTSVDLDTTHAEKVLEDQGQMEQVNLLTGYSIDVLGRMLAKKQRYDVIFLDSDNDSQLILHELMLARLMARRGALLMLDDIDLEGRSDAVKGLRAIPYLEAAGIEYKILTRDGGTHRTGFCVAWL